MKTNWVRLFSGKVFVGLVVVVVAIITAPLPAKGQKFFASEFQVAPGYQLSPAIGGQSDAAIAWGNTNYMLAWTDGRDSSYGLHMFGWASDVFGTRMTSGGTVLDSAGLPVNKSYSMQFEPALAWNGTNYLAVWSDGRGGYLTEDLYCTLVTEDGVPLAPDGVLVCGADGAQLHAAVGWDGSNFLVVWDDSRDGPVSHHIYAARIASDGTVLDPGGVPVGQTTGVQMYPAVAWDGIQYLIAWEHILLPADDLYGCLFNPLVPGGSQSFPICTQTGAQGYAAVTWNGVNFLVAWQDTRAGNIDIYAGRVTSTGVTLDPAGFPVATSPDDELFPALVSDGTGQSLMAYQLRNIDASPDVMGAFIGSGGSVSGNFPVSADPPDEKKPAVGFNGVEFMVAWEDNRAGEFQSDVYATRLTPSGIVMDPCGILVTMATPYRQSATADFDGNQYLIAWTEYNPEPDIACARVASDGAIVDSNAIIVSDLSTWERYPYVVATPAKSLVIWQDDRNYPMTGTDLYSAWVDPSGTVTPQDGEPVCTDGYDQERPAAAWNGANVILVVYEQFVPVLGSDIWGLILAVDGSPAIAPPFPICQAEKNQNYPSVAFDGSNFLVVWQDSRDDNPGVDSQIDIYGARVTPGGSVLDHDDGFPIDVSEPLSEGPRLAWDGQNYLVVYKQTSDAAGQDVYGVRVAPNGSAGTQPFPIAADPGDAERYPDVSWDGMVHVVCYENGSQMCAVNVGSNPGSLPDTPVCFEPDYPSRTPVVCHGPCVRHLAVYGSFLFDSPYGSYRIMARQFMSRDMRGDFNLTCDVDFKDFAVLSLAWLSEPGDGNWNRDCDISDPTDDVIDMKDLYVFCENWLVSK